MPQGSRVESATPAPAEEDASISRDLLGISYDCCGASDTKLKEQGRQPPESRRLHSYPRYGLLYRFTLTTSSKTEGGSSIPYVFSRARMLGSSPEPRKRPWTFPASV